MERENKKWKVEFMKKECMRNVSNGRVRNIRAEYNAEYNSKHIGDVGHTDDVEYRKILKELGIKKGDGEPLTESELCAIFNYMQEELFVGS